ncbi:MAG: hypothetical protein AB7P12_02995 [Alphaproteobacteria bacterium]
MHKFLGILGRFLIVVVISISPGAASGQEQNFRTVESLCVSPRYDHIGKDIEPSRLRYQTHPKGKQGPHTDDERLFGRALKSLLSNIGPKGKDETVNTAPLNILFAAYFHWDKGRIRQFGMGVICTKDFGSEKNVCRNRNYYFLSERTPEDISHIILNDITKEKPALKICAFRRKK